MGISWFLVPILAVLQSGRLSSTCFFRQKAVTRGMASRIVHLPDRSLIGEVPGRMVRAMFGKPFARQILVAILAFGIFLSGAAPSWAMPLVLSGKGATSAGMSIAMPGMTMQNDCMAMMDKGTPKQNIPCKRPDGSCAAVCTSCTLPVALLDGFLPVPMLHHNGKGVFASDVNRTGVSSPPALPPPILRV